MRYTKNTLTYILKAVLVPVIMLCLLVCIPAVLTLSAEGEWDESKYRVYTSDEQLTREEIDALDELCCEFVKSNKLDMVLMAIGSDDYADGLGETGLGFYDHNGFGYGSEHDGIVACYDVDKNEIAISLVGRAKEVFNDRFVSHYEEYLPTLFEKYGCHGVLYGVYYACQSEIDEPLYTLSEDEVTEAEKIITEETTGAVTTEATMEATTETVTEATTEQPVLIATAPEDPLKLPRDSYGLPVRNNADDKPTWYPADVSPFTEYHDSSLPRVVDVADIFTDEEETAMKKRIAEVSEETGKDIVIFTDVNTYGFDRDTYIYEFYDYCGYGYGDTYDGMALFICMDPNQRGFRASATGVVEDMYPEDIANDMDDALYGYLADGKYGEGVLDWIDNMYTLYTRGIPFVPEWLPTEEEKAAFVRTNNAESPRVYDSAELFEESEIEELESKAREISAKYGIDVVIHTTRRTYYMTEEEYADAFYMYNGYGTGENYDGILLTVFTGGSTEHIVIRDYGKGGDKLTKVNSKRLFEQTNNKVAYYWYNDGADIFLKNVAHLFKTGRVNKTTFAWVLRVLLAALIAWIVGGTALSKAKAKMKTVNPAFNADEYLDGTETVVSVCDNYITETVTKTKIVHETRSYSSSSSSSSSSRSSYHSHSTGSSGRSHTSSGRDF